ncbi:MAG: hypothetical protein R3314_04620 [Longimicrobiales bacterium]|nr:hypothetical protein [Longimicrobiales bacterium]
MKHGTQRRVRGVFMAFIIGAVVPGAVDAQEPAPVDSLRAELERLEARVDSLEQLLDSLRIAGQDTTEAADELAALRAAAEAAAGGAAVDTAADRRPRQFVGRQRSQQALNPEITVTGEVFGFVDLDEPDHDNIVPREVEFSFQSALDPYTLAKIFVGYHVPGGEIAPFEAHAEEGGEAGAEEEAHGHGGEFAVEEAYLQWRGLPGGFNVSAGRFRQNFGTLNRWHPHALPGQSYPLPYLAFFGEEGLAQSGVGVHWLAPVSGIGTWEFWTEVTTSSNEILFGESSKPSVMGRANAFFDLSRSTYFELGGTYLTGPSHDGADAFGTRVWGADMTLSWRPPERAKYREATLRGGIVYGEVATELGTPGDAFGGFANVEYRLGQQLLIGGRWEYSDNPLAPWERSWLVAPTLTWWQSEWVRIRLEYDYLERPDGGPLRLLVLQTTFAMGPHKHESY